MKTCLCIALWAGAVLLPAAQPPSVDKVLHLFDELRSADMARQAGRRQEASFQLTDAEINEYMQYALKTAARPGFESLIVKIFPKNYISTYTVVDFDAIERWKPGTVPSLLRPLLSGRKSIWVDCRFLVAEGQATLSVEKAYYNNIPLPSFVVEKVISIVAAQQPEKYDTSKPLPLPFGLRKVWTADHAVMGQN